MLSCLKSSNCNLWLVVFCSLIFSSCNLFSSLDSVSERQDISENARLIADQGDCVTARDMLANLGTLKKDDDYYTFGFSLLCVAGAKAAVIATTVVTYKASSGTDYTVIGKLARRLLPWSAAKENLVAQALDAFGYIIEPQQRTYARLVGHLVSLSVLIAKASGGRTTLYQDDISSSVDCTSIVTCPAGGMGDGDATAFRTEIAEMASEVGTLNFSGLKDLSTALNTTFGGLSDDQTRYVVRNNVVPSP